MIYTNSLLDALEDMLLLIDEHGDHQVIKAHATRIMKARRILNAHKNFLTFIENLPEDVKPTFSQLFSLKEY